MNKALYSIKIPKPDKTSFEETQKYDKQNSYINANFKQLFDELVDLKAKNEALEKKIAEMEQSA